MALANGEWKPSLALTGNLQYQEDGVNNLLNADNRSYAVGFALRIPLFATPAAMARKATAQAQVRQAEHGLKAATDNGRLEVDSARTPPGSARRRSSRPSARPLELARESLSIAQVSYENGVITSTELNDARQSLLETEWDLVQAQYAQIVAAAKAPPGGGTVRRRDARCKMAVEVMSALSVTELRFGRSSDIWHSSLLIMAVHRAPKALLVAGRMNSSHVYAWLVPPRCSSA